MKFTLTINLGNAAMETGSDVANALESIASRLDRVGNLAEDDDCIGGVIHDLNGNKVGSWDIED